MLHTPPRFAHTKSASSTQPCPSLFRSFYRRTWRLAQCFRTSHVPQYREQDLPLKPSISVQTAGVRMIHLRVDARETIWQGSVLGASQALVLFCVGVGSSFTVWTWMCEVLCDNGLLMDA